VRSELVYAAGVRIPNRFLLSIVAIKAVRKLHITTTRVEDTANRVFTDITHGNYINVKLPEVKPQPTIEPPLVSVAA
jgi:hypothetical protein